MQAAKSGHGARNAAIIIIVLVAAVSIIAVFFYYQPVITMTNISVGDTSFGGCGGLTVKQVYAASFSLVNTGPRDGFAIVALTEGSQVIETNTYFVPTGQTVSESMQDTLNCPINQPVNVQIQSFHP